MSPLLSCKSPFYGYDKQRCGTVSSSFFRPSGNALVSQKSKSNKKEKLCNSYLKNVHDRKSNTAFHQLVLYFIIVVFSAGEGVSDISLKFSPTPTLTTRRLPLKPFLPVTERQTTAFPHSVSFAFLLQQLIAGSAVVEMVGGGAPAD